MSTSQRLYTYHYRFLRKMYQSPEYPSHLVITLALLLTGLFLGRHVQLWEITLLPPDRAARRWGIQ